MAKKVKRKLLKLNNIPNRKCIGCGKVQEKRFLDRYVNIEKESILDNEKKLNGRGCYVCKNNSECLKKAIKRGRIYDR